MTPNRIPQLCINNTKTNNYRKVQVIASKKISIIRTEFFQVVIGATDNLLIEEYIFLSSAKTVSFNRYNCQNQQKAKQR